MASFKKKNRRGNPFDLAARSLTMLRSAALLGATTLASGVALFQQLKETKAPAKRTLFLGHPKTGGFQHMKVKWF